MKYLFTTLAVGKEYVDNAINCYSKINKIINCDFNITTNEKLKNIDIINNINFDYFSLNKYNDDGAGLSFFFNLKVLSLKYALDKDYDFVIYNDADWGPTNNLNEEKLLKLFDYMNHHDYDMLFERPAKIGYYKEHLDECFFTQKLYDYNVFEHDKWDDAHVTNEQFLVFKVNWKFRLFVRRWEQFLWYTIANKIRNYAEGFEIGVSAHETQMKSDFDEWRTILRDCFEFKDKQGVIHTRF
jgi:hypothetical protein